MFANIFAFEVRYWLRSWMLWIFLLIIGTLIFLAVSNEHVTIGGSIGNTFHNAPFVIQTFYSIIAFFTILMTTAFVNSAAARDFSYNTHQILFSTPMRRFDFLLGRFAGATLVSVIPMVGVSAGILLAKYMPWVDPDRWGPVVWKAHLYGILVFAVPNTILMAGILFAIAVLARNEIASFVGALLLLVGYAVTDGLLQNVDRARLAALLDPFGIQAYSYSTRYWTVAERNTLSLGLSGDMLWNRLIWLGVAGLVFAFAYYRFSFSERRKNARPESPAAAANAPAVQSIPPVTFHNAPLAKFFASVSIHFWGVVKSTVFIVIILAALLNCVPALAFNASQGYGNSTFPVTYWVLEIIAGTFYFFLVGLITYYAGVLSGRIATPEPTKSSTLCPVRSGYPTLRALPLCSASSSSFSPSLWPRASSCKPLWAITAFRSTSISRKCLFVISPYFCSWRSSLSPFMSWRPTNTSAISPTSFL